MSVILIGYLKVLHMLHLKGFYCQFISLAILITFLSHLKGLLFHWLLYSAITETRPCDLGLIALLLLKLMYGKLNHYVISTSNSMGSSEIWDKYHECCIGNGDKFHLASPHEIYPHFQYNIRGIYPKFHCYPCYSQLIPYSLHIRMLCISVAMYTICHYVLNTCQH